MGKDVSRFFDQKHEEENEKMLDPFIIGRIEREIVVEPEIILTEEEQKIEFQRIIEEEVSKFFPKEGENKEVVSTNYEDEPEN